MTEEIKDQWRVVRGYKAQFELEPVAEWDVIGTGGLIICLERQQIPNRWVRFWTKVFFTSKWQLPEDN